jgi:hypothetical protein
MRKSGHFLGFRRIVFIFLMCFTFRGTKNKCNMEHESLIKMKGELDGRIYKIRKGKNYSSKKPAPGIKKDEPGLKGQYSRTGFLNELASELNEIIKAYKNFIRPKEFYHNLLSRFRKEPENNRLLLLNRLKGMDINPRHPFLKISSVPGISVKVVADHIIVELEVNSHSRPRKPGANCYFFEVLILLWDDSGAPCELHSQKTSWIYPENGYPVYDIKFPHPDGTSDWMVCIRGSLGMNGYEYDELGSQGMLVCEMGSFNKKSQKLLKERRKDIEDKRLSKRGGTKKKAEEEIRVEPREVRM